MLPDRIDRYTAERELTYPMSSMVLQLYNELHTISDPSGDASPEQ